MGDGGTRGGMKQERVQVDIGRFWLGENVRALYVRLSFGAHPYCSCLLVAAIRQEHNEQPGMAGTCCVGTCPCSCAQPAVQVSVCVPLWTRLKFSRLPWQSPLLVNISTIG